MRAIAFELRAELRRHWRAWLALAVAGGLLAGAVAAAMSAARRTDSVLPRYLASSLATEVIVSGGSDFSRHGIDLERVRALPQVAASIHGTLVPAMVLGPGGRELGNDVAVEINPGARGDEAIDRWRIIAGRRAAADRPEEAVADRSALAKLGIGLGDTFRMRIFGDPRNIATVRIVGVRPDLPNTGLTHYVTASPAFYEAHGGPELTGGARRDAVKVRLRRGAADVSAFQRATERIAAGRDFGFIVQREEAAKLQAGFHLQAQALWVAAAFGAGAVLVLLGQGLARTLELGSGRNATLVALGMTPRGLAGLVVARATLVAGVAAMVTVPVAVLLSGLAPFGRAGDYETRRGVEADLVTTAAGVVLVILAALTPTAFAAARALRTRPFARQVGASSGPASTADALARAGAPPTLAGGVRMALPARGTLLGGALAVGVAAAALTVAASLRHLHATPRLYGQTWDYANLQGLEGPTQRDAERTRGDPAIAAAAYGQDAFLRIGGRTVGVAAYDEVKGRLTPTTVQGRAPAGANEVLLATRTFEALGLEIGDRVPVSRGERTVRMRVVGRGVIPESGWVTLGEGAAMTFAALKRIVPGASPSRLLLRLTDGAGEEAALRRLERLYFDRRPVRPYAVRDVHSVRRVPVVLAALVALVAAATLARTLLLAIRRRRRELAILKTMGFTRGQVRATIAWQATTVGVIALLVGLPVGVGAGRWAWTIVAGQLGVAPVAITPVLALLVLVPAVLVLVNAIAVLPARTAARTRPAVVLRAE